MADQKRVMKFNSEAAFNAEKANLEYPGIFMIGNKAVHDIDGISKVVSAADSFELSLRNYSADSALGKFIWSNGTRKVMTDDLSKKSTFISKGYDLLGLAVYMERSILNEQDRIDGSQEAVVYILSNQDDMIGGTVMGANYQWAYCDDMKNQAGDGKTWLQHIFDIETEHGDARNGYSMLNGYSNWDESQQMYGETYYYYCCDGKDKTYAVKAIEDAVFGSGGLYGKNVGSDGNYFQFGLNSIYGEVAAFSKKGAPAGSWFFPSIGLAQRIIKNLVTWNKTDYLFDYHESVMICPETKHNGNDPDYRYNYGVKNVYDGGALSTYEPTAVKENEPFYNNTVYLQEVYKDDLSASSTTTPYVVVTKLIGEQ